jgi:hypothetical protein
MISVQKKREWWPERKMMESLPPFLSPFSPYLYHAMLHFFPNKLCYHFHYKKKKREEK